MDISKIFIDLYKRVGDTSNISFSSSEDQALQILSNGDFGYFELVSPEGVHYYYMYDLGDRSDITFGDFISNAEVYGDINAEAPVLENGYDDYVAYHVDNDGYTTIYDIYLGDEETQATVDDYLYKDGVCMNTVLYAMIP